MAFSVRTKDNTVYEQFSNKTTDDNNIEVLYNETALDVDRRRR